MKKVYEKNFDSIKILLIGYIIGLSVWLYFGLKNKISWENQIDPDRATALEPSHWNIFGGKIK